MATPERRSNYALDFGEYLSVIVLTSDHTVPEPGTAWWLAKAEGRNHAWEVTLCANGTSTVRAVGIDGKEFDKFVIATPRTKPVE